LKVQIGTTVLSTAIASGLLLSGTAAQAAEVSEEALVAQESVAESQEVEILGEPVAEPDGDENAAVEPSVVSSGAETSAQSVPEETSVAVDQSVEEAPEPALQDVSDTEAPKTEVSEDSLAPEPTAEETEEAQAPVQKVLEPTIPVEKSAAPASPEPSKESSASFGVVSQDDRWDEIEALLPEGSEDWSDEQWEVFAETEAGEEYFRRLNELLEEEYPVEDDFEFSEEEQAFWDSILDTLPQDSLEWDDTQWEEYFRSDVGLEFIEQLLPIIADSIETDEDAADLQAFLEEVFADDPELRAYYLEMYLGITPETTGGSTGGSETVNEPEVSESEQPVADAEIKPVGSIGKAIVTKAQKASKSAEPEAVVEASAPALANTGFDGFWAAGVGILLAIGGVVFIARSRKASAK